MTLIDTGEATSTKDLLDYASYVDCAKVANIIGKYATWDFWKETIIDSAFGDNLQAILDFNSATRDAATSAQSVAVGIAAVKTRAVGVVALVKIAMSTVQHGIDTCVDAIATKATQYQSTANQQVIHDIADIEDISLRVDWAEAYMRSVSDDLFEW
jgi:hypothetical protein